MTLVDGAVHKCHDLLIYLRTLRSERL